MAIFVLDQSKLVKIDLGSKTRGLALLRENDDSNAYRAVVDENRTWLHISTN